MAADPLLMDRMFQRIMRGLIETGPAPHSVELARALGLPVDEGRRLLHDVVQAYPIGWLHPDTDYIASFPLLDNLPTQYRITVRGAQRWFAGPRSSRAPRRASSRSPLSPASSGRRRAAACWTRTGAPRAGRCSSAPQ